MWFLLYLIAVLILYALYKHNFYRQIWLSFKMPGPVAYPIIGNGLLFLNKPAAENFSTVCKIINDYGEVARVWVGPDLNVLLSDPKDVEVLLSSSKYIDKAGEYKFIKPWLNEGLLMSRGQKWFKRRKVLTPAFHFKILENFVEIFDRQSNIFITKLTNCHDEKVELYPIVTLYALDVICESAMGTSINAQTYDNCEYVFAVKEMAHVLHLRMFDFMLRIDLIFAISELSRKQQKALKILHDFTDNVILERRAEILRNRQNSANDDGKERKRAFLDILLESTIDGKPLKNLEIREEVDTFMFEGHDTTTSGTTFSLYNLAKYPEVQRKCFLEIESVIGTDNTKLITLQQLNELHYLDHVIKETLRLYPSVPLIGRTLNEEIKINNYTYPAGTNFVVPIYTMGRNPNLFPNADEFIPDRHNIEINSNEQNPFSYIPFSAGPRNCIGQKFAMLEMKSILSKILRYHEISLAADSIAEPILIAELILVPESKINFILKPRIYENNYY